MTGFLPQSVDVVSLTGLLNPLQIDLHFVGMYTRPATGEQCLHNAICIVNALRTIGIDYDIQVIIITTTTTTIIIIIIFVVVVIIIIIIIIIFVVVII